MKSPALSLRRARTWWWTRVFNYSQFGAKACSKSGGGRKLKMSRIEVQTGKTKTTRLVVPGDMVSDIETIVRSKRFDYAVDKDGVLYLYAGENCRFYKSTGGQARSLSLNSAGEMLAKRYGVGKRVHVDCETVHDSDGVPAIAFIPIGA